jgi:hypothetical protein
MARQVDHQVSLDVTFDAQSMGAGLRDRAKRVVAGGCAGCPDRCAVEISTPGNVKKRVAQHFLKRQLLCHT